MYLNNFFLNYFVIIVITTFLLTFFFYLTEIEKYLMNISHYAIITNLFISLF